MEHNRCLDEPNPCISHLDACAFSWAASIHLDSIMLALV